MTRSNGTTKKKQPQPEFELRAERAFRRVARKLRAESKRTGIPLAVWPRKDAALKKKKG
jgi:hypothetical protein